MIILQKNFNLETEGNIKPGTWLQSSGRPWRDVPKRPLDSPRHEKQLPSQPTVIPRYDGSSVQQRTTEEIKNAALANPVSNRPDIVNSSVNPEVQNPFFRDPVQTAIAKTRAAETDAILANNAHAQNESTLNGQISDHVAKERAAAAAATNNAQNLETIQDVPVIDTTAEAEVTPELETFKADRKAEAAAKEAKLRAETGLVRGKAQEYVDKGREKLGNLKETAAATWNKLSDSYGEGITGSLGTDAALAAGGLALAGGAYHLLKKRRAKKRAQKEALEGRIKK